MFSASEIPSPLETLKILTWRQVFTPKAYISNLTGPARVPASVTDWQSCIHTGRKPLSLKEVFLHACQNDHLSYFPKMMPV